MSQSEPIPQSSFDTVADIQESRHERYNRLVNEFIVAPAVILWDDWRTRIGTAIIVFYALIGTVGPMVYREPEIDQAPILAGAFQDPAYLLGTTSLGEDLLGLMIHSTPAMLVMLLTGGIFTILIATIVGTVSGYKRGVVDRILMTIVDIVINIPGLPLLIILAITIEPTHPVEVGLILSVRAWAGLSRNIRSEVLTIREESYVEASNLMGIDTSLIIRRDILPNIMPYIAIHFVFACRRVIFASVGLYFLGILPFSNLNWGIVLNQAYNNGALNTFATMHWLFVPIATIGLLTFGLVLFSQGTDRIFNPKIRIRHANSEEQQSQ